MNIQMYGVYSINQLINEHNLFNNLFNKNFMNKANMNNMTKLRKMESSDMVTSISNDNALTDIQKGTRKKFNLVQDHEA